MKVLLDCTKSIAFDSADYLTPWGTKRDNSRNFRFNEKLYALYKKTKRLNVLDLGCSGGGFVRDCLDDGHFSVGLEGSDFSFKTRRAEWRIIPENLFTCDITEKFQIKSQIGDTIEQLRFDVITAWEVLEHIPENKLSGLLENIFTNLMPGGLFIASVSQSSDIIEGQELHVTRHPADWWIRLFNARGFDYLPQYVKYFNTQFVRGPKFGAPGSFHVVFGLPGCEYPVIPHEHWFLRCYDRWSNSLPQRIIHKILIG
jgi:SAM-dependent methyltransferase